MKTLNTLKRLSNSPLMLLLCVVLGSLCGLFAAPVGDAMYRIGQVYLAIINMAAIPLLVVATFFGLRQMLELPQPWLRVSTIAALAAALVGVCALAGTLAGIVAMPGQHLSTAAHVQLGGLVLKSAGDAGEVGIKLFGPATANASASLGAHGLRELIPDNFYRVLAEGRPLGILTGTLLFGLAFTALPREQTRMLSLVFEGIYRTLENIIKEANLLIPALAFGTAAYLSAHTERATLMAMSSFIGYFALLTVILCVMALMTIAARAHLPFLRVLAALKEPLVVGFTSGSEMAPIPHTIEAMSTRLGFSRGVVELVVPLGAVFLRAGSALYFALVAIFVANLYERPLDAVDLVLIGVGSAAAAFASSGRSGVAAVGFSGMVLALLHLPVEAAGVLFVAIDLLCEGMRNVLSMLSGCTVIALVSAGLASERAASAEPLAVVPELQPVLQFAFSRTQLVLASCCVLTVASLIVLMGIGVGAR